MKKEITNGVWFAELDRFGYTLQVFGRTKEEADKAMRDEYIRAYARWNELDEQTLRLALEFPVADEDGEVDECNPYNEFAEYYRRAFEEFEPYCYEYGKVEWR